MIDICLNDLHIVRKSNTFVLILIGSVITIRYERFEFVMLFSNFGWRFRATPYP